MQGEVVQGSLPARVPTTCEEDSPAEDSARSRKGERDITRVRAVKLDQVVEYGISPFPTAACLPSDACPPRPPSRSPAHGSLPSALLARPRTSPPAQRSPRRRPQSQAERVRALLSTPKLKDTIPYFTPNFSTK